MTPWLSSWLKVQSEQLIGAGCGADFGKATTWEIGSSVSQEKKSKVCILADEPVAIGLKSIILLYLGSKAKDVMSKGQSRTEGEREVSMMAWETGCKGSWNIKNLDDGR